MKNPYLTIVSSLAQRKKTAVYFVGGCLRDFALGREVSDFDFTLKKGAITFARSFARTIKGAFVLLDEGHGSGRVVKKEGGLICTFDFTDFRGKTLAEDIGLRDFTVNTLCLEVGKPMQGIEDIKGALRDIHKKTVRMVSARVFKDDPLRLMRAYSLHAVLGFKIEPKTLAQIKKDKDLIKNVAMERVREELFKVLASSRAYDTLSAMDKIGLLPHVIPQLTLMYGVKQGGYHHLDVWKHSLEVVNQLEKMIPVHTSNPRIEAYLKQDIGGAHNRLSLLKLAAVLHDIGKPQTRKFDGKRMTFHTHEHVGKSITRHVAKQIKLSIKERYFLEDMVSNHLRPGYLSNFKKPTTKAVYRYMRDTGEEAASLALLALADQAATRGPLTGAAKHKHHKAICQMLIDKFFTPPVSTTPKERLLTGNDLIKKLKLKPSPLFGEILIKVEEAQALGKIKTKEEAVLLARKLAK